MTVFSKSVALKIDPQKYQPPTGIDIIYSKKNPEDEHIWATFVASDINSRLNEVKRKEDINQELSKLHVIQDTVKNWSTYRDLPTHPVKKVYGDVNHKMFDHELDYLRDKKQKEKGLIDSG